MGSVVGLLSGIIWLPVLSGILLLLWPMPKKATLWLGLVVSISTLLLVFAIVYGFDANSALMQFEERFAWIEAWSVYYHLGIDGISVWFLFLNALVTVLVILASWDNVHTRYREYVALILLMSGLLSGAFAALDGLLFYLFFEISLIPLYLVVGIWGGQSRIYAAFKFFLYTLVGSLCFLFALIYLYILSGDSFSVSVWHDLPLSMGIQGILFWSIFVAFAIKVPVWPLHTWLPEVHVEAPVGGSMILAAIGLKVGAYGLFRFLLPIVPDAAREYASWVLCLSIIAIIYIGLIALIQKDMKKLIAYSSVTHMGIVSLGIFLFSQAALEGALIQMISHGFVSAAIFYCIGVIYERTHSRLIEDHSGLTTVLPGFSVLFLLFAMANAGLPGTSGFVGEFMVIVEAVTANVWLGAAAATTLVLAAGYTLWLFNRVMFGELKLASVKVSALKSLNFREYFILIVLAVFVLWLGLYPKPFVDRMAPSVEKVVMQVYSSKI